VPGYDDVHTWDMWEQICQDHEEEFPAIRHCKRGTFNVKILSPESWYLPEDQALTALATRRGRGDPKRYKDGNYVSPLAMVTQINDAGITAWFWNAPQNMIQVL
jgi:hypothetical protein